MAEQSGSPKDLSKAFLEISEAEWEALVKSGVAHHLTNLIPLALAYQDDLEGASKFFIEVKELSLPPKIDAQLNLLDKIRVGISSVVEDENLEPDEVIELLDSTMEGLERGYTRYAKLEADTINTIKVNSKRPPKEAFVEKVRSYWNYIDEFWPSERESILGRWNQYFEETGPALQETSSTLRLGSVPSPHGVLIRVENLLKKRSSHLTAQRVSDALDRVKNYHVEELGLIPAYMGAKGNWKVSKDDCPDKRLPEMHTALTDRFAFCRKNGNACPSFDWSQGSYVRCKSFVRVKEASLLEKVEVLADKDFIEQLQLIAETDPFVRMLFVESDRRSGELFCGKVIDERLEQMLEQFPQSNRRGEFQYRVYMIANEPVLVSGNFAVAADKTLLETIGEGERMPKQASTLRIAGPVMRVTFTANAVRDPQFRDFLRKKNARKAGHFTYEVPFDREEEINFFLSEIRSEFNYKVEIFQIMEDADEFVAKDFGVYRYTDFPISRSAAFRLAMTYIPRAKARTAASVRQGTLTLTGAEKLVDVANNLPETHPLRARVAHMASRLRTGSNILVAVETDLIRYANGAIGLIPEPGTRWMAKDPDSGDQTMVEMVQAVRSKHGTSMPKYKVRRIDNGKEITLNRPWITPSREACGEPGMMPGLTPVPMPMALPGPVEGPPPPPDLPFGHVIGEDEVFYIVQVPKETSAPAPVEMAPPPALMPPPATPFGRFPGDVTLKVPPRVAPPGDSSLPFPPAGGNAPFPLPVLDGQPPVVEDHGPVVQTEEVFLVNPDQSKPITPAVDFSEQEILDDVHKKTKPGLKFNNLPRDPVAPSGADEAEVDEAVAKLRSMFKGDPRIKDVRRDLSSKGKPVLYLHSTMPRAMKEEAPSSVNGFEVILAPLHDSLYTHMSAKDVEMSSGKSGEGAEDASDVQADSLVNPLPNRPQNGKPPSREYPPGPYLDQVSGPPPMGDQLVQQVRDIPKGR